MTTTVPLKYGLTAVVITHAELAEHQTQPDDGQLELQEAQPRPTTVTHRDKRHWDDRAYPNQPFFWATPFSVQPQLGQLTVPATSMPQRGQPKAFQLSRKISPLPQFWQRMSVDVLVSEHRGQVAFHDFV